MNEDMRDPSLEEKYFELNQRFYSAQPTQYFRTRLQMLLLEAGDPEGVVSLMRSGVQYAGLRIRADLDDTLGSNELDEHSTVESQILLHHVTETLLRFFVAHKDNPQCPWLDIAVNTSPSRFKDIVSRQIIEAPRESLEDIVAFVFLGSGGDDDAEESEQLDEGAGNLANFLRKLAKIWRDEAHLYNALKHGLAIIPGNATIDFLADGTWAQFGSGPSIEYLEFTPGEQGQRTWQTTLRWVDVQESLQLVEIACLMIDSLWEVAKARYVGQQDNVRVFVPHNITPDKLHNPQRPPVRWIAVQQLDEYR